MAPAGDGALMVTANTILEMDILKGLCDGHTWVLNCSEAHSIQYLTHFNVTVLFGAQNTSENTLLSIGL